MKAIQRGLIFTCLLVSVFLIAVLAPAKAQSPNLGQLQADLNRAICLNHWNEALSALQQMIGADQVTPESRQQLVNFRYQLEDYRAREIQFNQRDNAECLAAIAPPSTNSSTQQNSPFDWEEAQRRLASRIAAQTASYEMASGAFESCNDSSYVAINGRCLRNEAARTRYNHSLANGDSASLRQEN
jgi:hypothetical protein